MSQCRRAAALWGEKEFWEHVSIKFEIMAGNGTFTGRMNFLLTLRGGLKSNQVYRILAGASLALFLSRYLITLKRRSKRRLLSCIRPKYFVQFECKINTYSEHASHIPPRMSICSGIKTLSLFGPATWEDFTWVSGFFHKKIPSPKISWDWACPISRE